MFELELNGSFLNSNHPKSDQIHPNPIWIKSFPALLITLSWSVNEEDEDGAKGEEENANVYKMWMKRN